VPKVKPLKSDALRLSPERQKSADEALLFSFVLANCLKQTLQGDY
jgi:hypothetical protein